MKNAVISNSLTLSNSIDYDILFTDSPFIIDKKENVEFIEDFIEKDKKSEYVNLIDSLGTSLNNDIVDTFLEDYDKSNNIYFFRPHVFLTNLFIKCKALDEISSKYKQHSFTLIMDKKTEECILSNASSLNKYGNIYSKIAEYTNIDIVYGDAGENKVVKGKKSAIYDLLRVLSLPLSFYLNTVYEKLKLTSKLKNKIYVNSYNEVTREIKSYLIYQGIGYSDLSQIIKKINVDSNVSEQLKSEYEFLLQDIEKLVDRRFSILETEFYDKSYFNAFKSIFIESIFESLIILREYEKVSQKVLVPFLEKNKDIKIMLSHGLFGLKGLAITNTFKRFNIKLVTSMHGLSIGFAKVNDLVLPYNTDSLNANVVFAFNEQAQQTYKDILKDKVIPVNVGAPYELKTNKFKGLKKLLSESLLQVHSKKETLFFVSTLEPRNNYQMLKYGLSTNEVYQLEKKILIALSKTNKHIIYKTYDASLYVDENPNIQLAKELGFTVVNNYDFRYIKNAGDILLSILATSTIGWCIGADKPFVYLNSISQYQLQNETVQDAFEKSFFLLDYEKDAWEENLISFFNKPYKEIKAQWDEKEKYRKEFDTKFLLSTDSNTGKLGAKFIKDLLERE